MDHERATLIYLHLASTARARGQLDGRDRMLVLAALHACQAGCLDIAELCRSRILDHNPHHWLAHTESCAEAMRDKDSSSFFRSVERNCNLEHAELLVAALPVNITDDLQDFAAAASRLIDNCTPPTNRN